MPTITVRLFAQLREHCGAELVTLEVPPGATLSDVHARLITGPLAALPVAYAQNHSYAPPSAVVADGDELAFLPPVGGG